MAALIERALRQNMLRLGIKAIPIRPEGRDSKTPTYEQILCTFAGRTKHQLYEQDRLIKTFIDPFTEIQKTGLKLLEIGPAVYR